MRIPDAPYIVEAERYGMPHPPVVKCPCCGKECETIYMVDSDEVGCEHCVRRMDSVDWMERRE